jgi:hypothetical protein
MTAGQGGGPYGPPTGPSGPPQGWSPPPSPPPYGQQYPGYEPAPTTTGYGAPAPVERPLTVRAGIGAFVGGIVLSVVVEVIRLLEWDTVFGPALEGSMGPLSPEEADMMNAIRDSLGVIGFVVGLAFTALYALFVWFAWRGHNWARIVVWALAGLGLAFNFLTVASGGGPLPIINALTVFEMLFDAAGIVLLALKPSSDWYRFRRWQRATGQG